MNRAFTLWLTGLSGSGKSTLAREVQVDLAKRGYRVEILDGDEVRRTATRRLGFSKADRDLNVRFIGTLAGFLSRNGVVAIVAAISPYLATRQDVRRRHGGAFVEVYVKCGLEELVRRDPKGLYAKALRGEVERFTGISDPYEPPISPEITVCTENERVSASRRRIITELENCGLIPEIDETDDIPVTHSSWTALRH
jgi:adenylyl-sulfate kinase